jgi:hypothetical protein
MTYRVSAAKALTLIVEIIAICLLCLYRLKC